MNAFDRVLDQMRWADTHEDGSLRDPMDAHNEAVNVLIAALELAATPHHTVWAANVINAFDAAGRHYHLQPVGGMRPGMEGSE